MQGQGSAELPGFLPCKESQSLIASLKANRLVRGEFRTSFFAQMGFSMVMLVAICYWFVQAYPRHGQDIEEIKKLRYIFV
jgi:hypothetical protein